MAISSPSKAQQKPKDTQDDAPLAFIDLAAQQACIRDEVDAAIARVLRHGTYIMGPEIGELEARLAAFSGAEHAITCGSGTDALLMILMAQGIGPGDAVICPAFTFTATPEVIALLGATPIFVDVEDDTFNLAPSNLGAALATAEQAGLTVKAVLAVDLFGQTADYAAIENFAAENGLWVLADAAQSFGGSGQDRKVGTFGLATATSFFPAKPLGCYGDGGAILTNDGELAECLRSIRVHGQGTDKYDNVRIGINGRMDTLQAAILIEKLKIFEDEIAARNRVAERYSAAFADRIAVPIIADGARSVWAQYTLKLPAERRADIQQTLKAAGIPTAIYYPKPLHRQTAYRDFPIAGNGTPVSDRLTTQVLSLPMHPYLSEQDQDRVISALSDAMANAD
jgi:dTDP-4-amino-4,6-dideoxygalactose transaminase